MRLFAFVCLALATTTTQLVAQQTTPLANPLKALQDPAQRKLAMRPAMDWDTTLG